MNGYKHILLAVDLSPASEYIAARAADMARQYSSRLSLIHVVEYLPMDVGNEWMLPPQVDVEGTLVDNARRYLMRLAATIGRPEAECWVPVGSPKTEVTRAAKDHGVDLIVLGRHGRHGLALILGSTANAVLHAAPCDVLAVRIPPA